MTLARRHIQRLWYPEPGQGGAIPSRAEHAIPGAVFDEHMPREFWREVVDRVAAEAPDTLLLAEAFWLLEGYFVRTLGMHRVYNSAFMNMLRDEENAGYRRVVKDTLEFDPEVLKRYVNFMSNPDERTAIDQFGNGDKYFGVCTLLATMPGLPMIGHGQVEGFSEKYGMEYRRAYRDEHPDGWLVERHEREVFPLFHRRYLFAGVADFLLYDFFETGGSVNEDVFAYSNRLGNERALIVYHNRFAETSGWIRTSVAYSVPDGGGRRSSALSGRGAGPPPGRRLVRGHARAPLRPRVPASVGGSLPGRAVRGVEGLRLPGVPGHSRSGRRWVQGGCGGSAESLAGASVPSVDAALREFGAATPSGRHSNLRGQLLAADPHLDRGREGGGFRTGGVRTPGPGAARPGVARGRRFPVGPGTSRETQGLAGLGIGPARRRRAAARDGAGAASLLADGGDHVASAARSFRNGLEAR